MRPTHKMPAERRENTGKMATNVENECERGERKNPD